MAYSPRTSVIVSCNPRTPVCSDQQRVH
ncbi:hypothetical protein FQN60_017714 [Etheostoma spectabile]|uniref:Uncharacterized protein n=1 Tax=Etheostoma spectabile TaxID=54343 RepID=A0A5J5DG47_9PERO|nr:hypothetical protein FQN60_017714 [Etheostoma spectabile]